MDLNVIYAFKYRKSIPSFSVPDNTSGSFVHDRKEITCAECLGPIGTGVFNRPEYVVCSNFDPVID